MTTGTMVGRVGVAALVALLFMFTACAEVVDKPAPPPDTVPRFAAPLSDQTYQVGQSVDLTLPGAASGNGALSYSLTPDVPGLAFDAETRTLSGTPSTAGTWAMTYTVADADDNTDPSDTATLRFTITTTPAPPPDTAPTFAGIVPVTDQTYQVGTAVNLSPPAAAGGNGALSYSLTPDVPGLAFDAETRMLSGTPSTAGTWAMTYTVADADDNTDPSDTATLRFTITTTPAPPPDTAPNFAGTVPVTDQTYQVGTAVNLSLPAAAGGNGALSYSLTPDVPGLAFAAETRTLSGTPSTAGTWAMTYTAADTDDNTNPSDTATLRFTITTTPAPPPDTAPNFAGTVPVTDQTYQVGTAVNLSLPAAAGGNGALSYSLTPDVPGLAFAAETRTLSGTPSTAGTWAMTYTAADTDDNTNPSDTATLRFTITITPAPDTAPTFAATAGNQTYDWDEYVNITLPAATGGNGTLTYSLTPDVPGLTFAAETRTLSGTPTTPLGTYAMTYAVADADDNTAASDTATQSFTITTIVPLPSCHTYDDPNFLLTYTPTLFLDATYLGRFNRFISRDGNHTGPDPELIPGDFYQVRFSDGSNIEIATNPDQISRSFGSELVEGFGRNLGSAPEFLRNDLDRLQISHVADPNQTGGGFWVTQEQIRTVNLYISYFTYDGELKDPSSWPWTKDVVFRHWDSVLIHELAHHFDIVDYRRPRPRGTHSASSGWAAAQAADGKHISEYAKTRDEEDFAETMKFYLPLRYMPERWCPEASAYIQATIPHRIRYLDENLKTDGRMCPVVQEDC